MKKIKKFFYPIITIGAPLICVFLGSIWLSSIFKFIDFTGNGFLIQLSEITFNHPRRVAFVLIFISLLLILRFKFYKEKEFAKPDIYGDYPIYIYFIAWFLLGYNKVNLKMKPIPLQFQLLNLNVLNCYDDTEYSEKDFNYKVHYTGKINKDTKQVNIIVSDTYQIKKTKLPESVKYNYTISVDRDGEEGIRIHSQKLIEIISKEVQSCKKYCKNFNLFLSTPATTNKRIFCQIFQTGLRDKFIINIYQQDSENNFKFKDKPITIKC